MGARQQRSSVAAGLLWSIALAFLASACGSSSISVTSPGDSKCPVSVGNSMTSVPATGASGTLTIKTNRDCTWSASTSTSWISLMSSASGQGEAALSYRVDGNVDPFPRHGMVTVNDVTADITQEAAPCRFTVTPPAATSPAAGGPIRVAVAASSPACGWTAESTASWITVTAGSSGSGNGTVTLNVLPNGGDAREGHITVAGQPVIVSQPALASDLPAPMPLPAPSPDPSPSPSPSPSPTPTPTPTPGSCKFTLDPPTQAIAATGGNGAITVTTGPACTWTATPAASWITLTAGANVQGSGTASFTAAANNGPARSTTIQIGSSTATITQPAASCSYTIAPSSQSIAAGGGTGSVTVTADAICAWTATKDVPWISITSGASGTGHGTVSFSVSPNTGPARSATVTIAGKPFSVTQASGCSVSIAPGSQSIAAGGGTGTVAVTAASGCAWNATNMANWLTITSASSGSGNGSINFSAAANTGPARSGTLIISGQTFTVSQEGVSCSFAIAPSSQNVAVAGGTGSVTVTTGGTCSWTAASSAVWIIVTAGASGTGNGSVAFAVLPNVGTGRSGTITVAGQTFTVTQDGLSACSFTIAPTSQNIGAGGGSGTVTVTATGTGCTWTASSNADWLTVTAGSSGTGNGAVTFSADRNRRDRSRSGTLTIAGQTFTVSQSGS
jgi:Viral BACON domain/Putative binding domain, N-terminal